MSEELERRSFLAALGAAATGVAVGPATAGTAAEELGGAAALREAFQAWVGALNGGSADTFIALHHPQAQFIDEDTPFRMDRAEFVDHLGFHDAKVWESFSWVPRTSELRIFGSTGIVAGQATFRGKPRDSGFRLRHLLYVLGWTRESGHWSVVTMHLSPVLGHIIAASPS